MTLGSQRFRGLAFWAVALALLAGMIAPTSMTALAQDEVAEYEAPDGIEEISGTVEIDGSSTVGPITEAVAEEFRAVAPEVEATVNVSGTGGGFERFCAGETDINDASRAIAEDEIALCEENGVEYYRFQVATDGIAFVVNPENDFAECLTVDQLAEMWQLDSEVTTWDQVDGEFPEEEIALFGPDPDSGTYDYFVEVVDDVLGSEDGIRSDYTQSVDDNVLVEGVAGEEFGLGYFGYAFYDQNQDALKVLQIDGGDGCVEPSAETVQSGEYAPLSRPLYIYVNAESIEDEAVQEFLRFYLATAPVLVADVGYFQAPTEESVGAQERLEAAVAGEGEPDSAVEATPEA